MKLVNQVHRACALALVFVLTAAGITALAADRGSNAALDKAAFEKLKSLSGEWRGSIGSKGSGEEMTVLYRTVAAGSAVVETLFPNTPHEMITVYYLDKGKLVLTHYCAAGNQPRMALAKGSTADDLSFNFAGGSNLKASRDGHMHSARLRFESANAVAAEWDYYKDGKKADTKKFYLSRKGG